MAYVVGASSTIKFELSFITSSCLANALIFFTIRMIDDLGPWRITMNLLHCRRVNLRHAILIRRVANLHMFSYNETEEVTAHRVAFFIKVDGAGEVAVALIACLFGI